MHPPFFIELLKRQWTPDTCIDECVPHDERHGILEVRKSAGMTAVVR
jgi:hypothetical protein